MTKTQITCTVCFIGGTFIRGMTRNENRESDFSPQQYNLKTVLEHDKMSV